MRKICPTYNNLYFLNMRNRLEMPIIPTEESFNDDQDSATEVHAVQSKKEKK